MRIVNEIYHPCQTAVFQKGPYVNPRKKESIGFRVEIFCAEGPQDKPEDQPLEIEGDAACILFALRELVSQIEMHGELLVDKGILTKNWQDLKARFKMVRGRYVGRKSPKKTSKK